MGSFSENLRREREMRGVTLEEISASTKISVRFLKAIEAEEFDKLPGGIFTRSFIRSYAKYLGLDDERLLAECPLAVSPREDASLKRLGATQPPAGGSISRTLPTLGVAAALLLGGYLIYRYSRRGTESPPNASGEVSAAPASTQSQSEPPPTPAPDGTIRQTPQSASTSSQPSPPGSLPKAMKAGEDGLVLQIAPKDRVWVSVEADGKTVLQRVLNPNETQTIKAKQFFDLTIGNAEGIVLTLNDQTLKPLGRRGEVKSVHLSYDDLKNPSP